MRFERIVAVALLGSFAVSASAADSPPLPAPLIVPVFSNATLHFLPDSAAKFAGPGVVAEEAGRIARTTCPLPDLATPHRIEALLTLSPIPQSEREVFDRWDRAGNVRLVVPGMPDLEIVRFMTSYGGRTEHEIDVTSLAPLLRGTCDVRAFVDTWVSPGWRIDLSLRYTAVAKYDNSSWAAPVYYTDSFNREEMPNGSEVEVEIPPGLSRIVLEILSTGHCTDGVDEDEFVSKANVVAVDGHVVERFHPWRDDCRRFRDRNPYTSHWKDGSWSSDYSRSGWCPGVEVTPREIDLSDVLTAGPHTLRFVVENMRPRDATGQFGYWRLSARLVGWDRPPSLWRNE